MIGEDKNQIEQTLQGHSNYVFKVIEIKENELISISHDITILNMEIKQWK